MSLSDVLEAKPKEPELYKMLGCDETATTEQIVAEYRARVRDAHPDKFSKEENETSTEKFMKLQNAYSILSDESRRKTYDTWLRSPFPVTFDEFAKNCDTFQMSTHWAVPKSQPSIGNGAEKSGKRPENPQKSPSKWADGDRYQSKIASDFRNYKLPFFSRRVGDSRDFMNAYSFDGLVIAALLFICTCAYLKRVPRVSSWLLSEKKGFFGVFYKAAVIGVRLHTFVALSCLVGAVYVVLLH